MVNINYTTCIQCMSHMATYIIIDGQVHTHTLDREQCTAAHLACHASLYTAHAMILLVQELYPLLFVYVTVASV